MGMSWPSAEAKSRTGHSCHRALSLPKVGVNKRSNNLPSEPVASPVVGSRATLRFASWANALIHSLDAAPWAVYMVPSGSSSQMLHCVCATTKTNVIILSLILNLLILFLLFWALFLFPSQKSLSRSRPLWPQLGSEPTWIITSGELQNHGWGTPRSWMFPQLKLLTRSPL